MKKKKSAPEQSSQTILEEKKRFSQSLLWAFQRQFFEQQGIQAWNTGKVPHYATSNPFIASAYGKVVFGFLRDCKSDEQTPLDPEQPVYILELGAGSGRFAYHFLKKFFAYYSQSVLQEVAVKYVMSDLSQQNLDFWRSHPSLQPFLEQGVLDFASFDVEKDQKLQLLHSGEAIAPETLKNPLIVLANYFFDSIPQDLFYIQGGQLYETRVTLTSPEKEPDLKDAKLLERLEISYDDRAIAADYYENPDFNQILQQYQHRLAETSLLFPFVGLQCLCNLRHLSSDRLLLLSGDKGYSREEELLGRQKPKLTLHQGCFSLMVNYHAIAQYARNQGGQVLTTAHRHRSVNICAFRLGGSAEGDRETHQAYRDAIEQCSPDDFFALKKGLEPHYNTLTLQQLLAFLRLSGWDFNIFFGCFPRFMSEVAKASETLRREAYRAIYKIWDTYYFMGEQRDLAFHLGMLLYGMDYLPEALDFFQRSRQLHGEDPITLYNLGMCHYRLRQLEEALTCVTKTLELNPNFEAAKEVRIKICSEIDLGRE